MSGRLTYRYRPILLSVAAILLAPSLALAQSPWERAASNLALTFTGPLALILGAATFNLFYSFLAGLLMFGGLYGFALWATRRDPDMLRILLASSKTRRRYDPGKHEPFGVEVVSC